MNWKGSRKWEGSAGQGRENRRGGELREGKGRGMQK